MNLSMSLNNTALYVFIYGSIDGWGAMLQAEKSRVRVPDEDIDFFSKLPKP
jgi:hypothetical protein